MKTKGLQFAAFLLLAAALAAACALPARPRPSGARAWRTQPAQPHDPILFPATRLGGREYLNGDWSFRLRPAHEPRTVKVPHVWNTMPGLESYAGRAVYTRTFKVPRDWDGRRILLHFEGVAWSAAVDVNDIRVGRIRDGFLPAAIDITEDVSFQTTNRLRVTVSNAPPPRGAAPGRTLANWGGLFREVYLEPLPQALVTHIRVAGIRLLNQAAAVTFSFSVSLPRDDEDYVLYAMLLDPAGAVVSSIQEPVARDPGADTPPLEWDVTFDDPALWSVDNPALYSVLTKLARIKRGQDVGIAGMESLDETFLTFGVRTFEIADEHFLFNGEEIYLRGADRAEDLGPASGPVQDIDGIRRDVALARSAGFNTLRTLHMPPHPGFLDVCDRAGMFVIEDLPLENIAASGLGGDALRARARSLLRAMIRRDAHHPSILAWGLGTGMDTSTPAGREFVDDLRALAADLDPTRPTYVVPRPGATAPGGGGAIAGLDAGALDTARGAARVGPALDAFLAASPGAATLAFGLGSHARLNHVSGAGRFGAEQTQLMALAHARMLVDERPGLDGDFIHALSDYPLPGGRGANLQGLLSRDRKPKAAWFWLQRYDTDIQTRLPRAPRAILPVAPPWSTGGAALLLAFLGLAVWSGLGRARAMLGAPQDAAPAAPDARAGDLAVNEKSVGGWISGLAYFGAPALLISIFAGAAFLNALLQWTAPLAASLPPALQTWHAAVSGSPAAQLGVSAALQLAGLLFSGALAALFLNTAPAAAAALLARCLFPRLLLFVPLLLPWPAPVLAALPLVWEFALRARALAVFTHRESPAWAVAALPVVLYSGAALILSILAV